jgi:gliding motility-associated-like protein
LSLPSTYSSVNIGDLDITGNQLTVECLANRTSFFSNGTFTYSDLVSKHTGPGDVNYTLRPTHALVTTSTGFHVTPDVCTIDLNKTYHYAMTYDGTTLKFYRNGFLMSQVACTGNLVQNNLLTGIGVLSAQTINENFIGYINEVRIWNVARTQAQIRTYMYTPLPNPTTQTGLQAYYTFNSLSNLQGNASWNGVLTGSASLNANNPNCSFVQDSCGVVCSFPVEAGLDTAICSNTPVSVTLHGKPDGAASYSWSPATFLNNPNSQDPIATINNTTKFYLTAGSSFSCSGIDSVTVTINQVPLVKTLGDTAVCRGTNLILTTGPGAITYNWSPGIYVNDSTIASPRYIDNNSQRLYVMGTNSYGCSGKDTIDVTIKSLPVVKTIKDSTICSPQSITLTTTGASNYSWTPAIYLSDPNSPNPVFSGTNSQTYEVTGTASNGCSAKDTVAITVFNKGTFLAPPDKSTCRGTGVVLNGNNGTSVNYLWSPGTNLSNPNIINPVANPGSTMTYQLVVSESQCGYDSTFNVVVTVNLLPVINASRSNDVDCLLKIATLHAEGGIQYLWSPGNSLSDPNSSNPLATPATDQNYVVKVTTDKGCVGYDSVMVLSKSGVNIEDIMPSAFAPAGYNKCYGLPLTGGIREFNFMIYSRWGELMFITSAPTACWDGTFKGKPAQAGTYVYYIKASNYCGKKETTGTFQLLR